MVEGNPRDNWHIGRAPPERSAQDGSRVRLLDGKGFEADNSGSLDIHQVTRIRKLSLNLAVRQSYQAQMLFTVPSGLVDSCVP